MTSKREIQLITRDEFNRQAAGAEILGPGLWRDRDGHLHFAIPEILAAFELPDTPEIRERVMEIFQEIARANGAVEFVVQDIRPDS